MFYWLVSSIDSTLIKIYFSVFKIFMTLGYVSLQRTRDWFLDSLEEFGRVLMSLIFVQNQPTELGWRWSYGVGYKVPGPIR